MRKLILLFIFIFSFVLVHAQTNLTEAVDFSVKTVTGETIKLFPLLDEQNKIVVIDFFSTSCGPCQDYAPDFQNAYELFNSNNGNVFFMGMNYNSDNREVMAFDSIFELTYPSVSGTQGGGNNVYEAYNIVAYPTVIVITPDHQVVEQFIWPPSADNIVNAVYAYGGLLVGNKEVQQEKINFKIFPNPANEQASLSINANSRSVINYNIIDQLGRKIFISEDVLLQQGINKIKLPVSSLQNGIYFVTITGEANLHIVERFVISN